jgi:hypothetical protein
MIRKTDNGPKLDQISSNGLALFSAPVCNGGPGKFIAPFIFGMTGMTAYPVPFNIVLSGRRQQTFPEIAIGDIFALAVFPPFFDPPFDPLGHPFFYIL